MTNRGSRAAGSGLGVICLPDVSGFLSKVTCGPPRRSLLRTSQRSRESWPHSPGAMWGRSGKRSDRCSPSPVRPSIKETDIGPADGHSLAFKPSHRIVDPVEALHIEAPPAAIFENRFRLQRADHVRREDECPMLQAGLDHSRIPVVVGPLDVLSQRTAFGSGTAAVDTTIVSPWTRASAQWNSRSSPARENSSGVSPFRTRPPSAWSN